MAFIASYNHFWKTGSVGSVTSTASNTDAENLQTPTPDEIWRSTSTSTNTITYDFAATNRTVQLIGILYTNMSGCAIDVKNSAGTTVASLTTGAGGAEPIYPISKEQPQHLWFLLDSAVSATQLVITCDTTNYPVSESYFEIAGLWASDIWSPGSSGFDFDWKVKVLDAGGSVRANSGAHYSMRRKKRRQLQITASNLDRDLVRGGSNQGMHSTEGIHWMLQQAGYSWPVVACPNALSVTSVQRMTMLGHITQLGDLSANDSGALYKQSLTLTETV